MSKYINPWDCVPEKKIRCVDLEEVGPRRILVHGEEFHIYSTFQRNHNVDMIIAFGYNADPSRDGETQKWVECEDCRECEKMASEEGWPGDWKVHTCPSRQGAGGKWEVEE